MDDTAAKPLLPIHDILGTKVYVRIETDAWPRIGNQGEPGAECTKFGWTIRERICYNTHAPNSD